MHRQRAAAPLLRRVDKVQRGASSGVPILTVVQEELGERRQRRPVWVCALVAQRRFERDCQVEAGRVSEEEGAAAFKRTQARRVCRRRGAAL